LGFVVFTNIKDAPVTSERKSMLWGRVLNENNKPIKGAHVLAYLPRDQKTQDHTDWRGRYQLTGLPDDQTFRVNVFYTGFGHNSFDSLTAGGEFDLQIHPHGYKLYDKQPPPLQLAKWFNSQPLSLSELRGKVVLLHIGIHIDTYSDYNRKVLQMYEKYRDQGLAVIAIYINSRGSWPRRTTDEEITDYLEQNYITFPVALDQTVPSASLGVTYAAYEAQSCPAKYLIDKKGVLRCSPTDKNLEKWIKRLLAER
jgi:glutathione peroxidase-family protein